MWNDWNLPEQQAKGLPHTKAPQGSIANTCAQPAVKYFRLVNLYWMLSMMDLAGYLHQQDSLFKPHSNSCSLFFLCDNHIGSTGANPIFNSINYSIAVSREARKVVPRLTLATPLSDLMFRIHQEIGMHYLPWMFVLQDDHPPWYKFVSSVCLFICLFVFVKEHFNIPWKQFYKIIKFVFIRTNWSGWAI